MDALSNMSSTATDFTLPAWFSIVIIVIIFIVIWSAFWKSLALWHSAQRSQPAWFVILLIVNTAGILDLIYLFGVAKLKFSELFSVKH